MLYLFVVALHWASQNVQVEWVCEGNSYMLMDPDFRPWRYKGCNPYLSIVE